MRTSIRITAIAGVLALATLGVGGASAAPAGTIYDGIPSPQPSNMPSLGYQATQTAEFGDDIAFAAGDRTLQSVNVYMSSWACETGSWELGNCATTPGATFTHPITLRLYAVTHVGDTPLGAPVLGAVLKTVTTTFTMPYRPSADASCPDPAVGGWKNAAGNCFNGFGFVISFNMAGFVVPDEVVYGIAYNTMSWGAAPLDVTGPYDSLNVGVAPQPAAGVGTDVDPDLVFWNTMTAGNYTDGGAAGVGTFRADTGWRSTGPAAVQFVATPAVAPTTTTVAASTTTVTATTTVVVAAGGPVPAAAAVQDASGTLPGTGSNSSNGLWIALVVIAAGVVITLVARRRNHA